MKKSLSTLDIAYIGIFAAVMAICSWITIPTVVPFTLQTFAVFLTCYLLGGKRGTITVLIYILLGAIGIPVFAGFSGGPEALFGMTGGYIIGFIFTALIMWAFEAFLPDKLWITIISMILGLIACYAIGTAWFMIIYTSNVDATVTLATVLGWCVIPFIIPDLAKIALATILGNRLKKVIKI